MPSKPSAAANLKSPHWLSEVFSWHPSTLASISVLTVARLAVLAAETSRTWLQSNAVPDLESRDVRADLSDDTGALVAEDEGVREQGLSRLAR